VYGELRRLASRYLRHEPLNHTLQPTALVHEAYLRLVGTGGGSGSLEAFELPNKGELIDQGPYDDVIRTWAARTGRPGRGM